jgi:hypothetical protein
MMGPEDLDSPFEEFLAAQGGAVAHLETMSQVVREAAEDILATDATGARSQAARLSQIAEQCDALGFLIAILELSSVEESG